MKIIKEGKIPPKTWRRTCDHCSTEFEYDSFDIKREWDEGAYVKCPVCGARIWHIETILKKD